MINFLIGLCFGSLLTVLIVILILRKFNSLTDIERQQYEQSQKECDQLLLQREAKLQEQEQEIKSQRLAIQQIIFTAHHSSGNENFKRIRGLLSVLRLDISSLIRRVDSMGKTTWGAALSIDYQNIEKKYISEIENQCLEGEKKIIENVSRFNHLQ